MNALNAPSDGRIRPAVPPVSAVLAFGSNLGDREATIHAALADLDATDGIEVDRISRLYETVAVKPDGVDFDAPGYLNAVATVRTTLDPEQLLDVVNGIEQAHGRVRLEHWGDRTLDVDIIVFGAERRDTARLTLPHPRAGIRDFVLVPWLEIDPDASLAEGRADALLREIPETTVRPYAGEPR